MYGLTLVRPWYGNNGTVKNETQTEIKSLCQKSFGNDYFKCGLDVRVPTLARRPGSAVSQACLMALILFSLSVSFLISRFSALLWSHTTHSLQVGLLRSRLCLVQPVQPPTRRTHMANETHTRRHSLDNDQIRIHLFNNAQKHDFLLSSKGKGHSRRTDNMLFNENLGKARASHPANQSSSLNALVSTRG